MTEDERPASPAEAGSPKPLKRGVRRPRVEPGPKDEGAERALPDDTQPDDDDGGSQLGAVNRSRPIYDTPPNGRSRGGYGPSGPRGNYGAPGARGRPPRGTGPRGDAQPRYGSDRAPYARLPEGPPREGRRDDRAPRSRDARPSRGSYDRPRDTRAPRRDGGGGGERTRPYRGRPGDGPRPYGDRTGDRTGDGPRPYGSGTEPTRSYGEPTGENPRPYRGRDPRDAGSRSPGPRDTRPVGPGDTDRRGPRPQSGGYDRGPRQQSGGYDRGPRPQTGGGYGPRPRPQSGGYDRRPPGGGYGPRPEAGGSGPRPARPRYDRNDRGREADADRAVLPEDPREAALRILHAVDTRSAFSDRMLDSAHAVGGDPRDRALLHELVKGALRWRGRIDWALEARVHQGLAKTPPWIRNVLRLGAYQLLFLDRVPAHAVVDESVKLAHEYGHPGTAGLVNSVLRRLDTEKAAIAWPDGDDVESLAVWGSHPQWIVERWLDRFGPEATRALLLADNEPARLGLRVNPLRTTREGLIERLATDGVTAQPAQRSRDLVWVEGHHGPLQIAAFRDGWCTVQDESEALVTRLVAPREHERILDLCAAPGGKCTHIAELMGDEGEVWAMERQASRIQSLEQNLSRLGIHSVHVVEGDGRTYTFPMPFDRVLVDAPCSGLGVLGRRADARWRKGPEILREMPPLQLELLLAASQRARPGGVVVYSVCSFEPEETDAVVDRFLRQDPSVVLESAEGALPEDTVDEQGLMRVFPHVHGCDGAFAARFRKT